MFKKHSILSAAALMLCIMLLFSACSSSSYATSSSYSKYEYSNDMAKSATPSAAPAAPRSEEYPPNESGIAGSGAITNIPGQTQSGRKLIWTADISIRSKEFDKDMEDITKIIENAGGWMEYSNISGIPFTEADGYGRNAQITARIPINKFEDSMNKLSSVGVTERVSSSSEDISLSYSDTELRKRSVQTQLDRMLELLEKASKMEDIITIEKEISRLTYELESLSRQLIRWDNSVDYATVSISLREKESYNITYSSSFSEKLSNSFSYGINAFRIFLEGLALAIASTLPFIILIVIIIVIILVIIRAKRKKHQGSVSSTANTQAGGFGQVIKPNADPSSGSKDDNNTPKA